MISLLDSVCFPFLTCALFLSSIFVLCFDVSGAVVYFLSLFTSVCVVMPLLILIFSGVVFLEKSISMVGLFVCSWFCTISVRDPLDVMELILLNTLNT